MFSLMRETKTARRQLQKFNLNTIHKCLENYFRFLSQSDLGSVLREDDRVLSKIRDFIRSRFGSNGLCIEDPNFMMAGREQQEFENLVEEVDRVRFSYAGLICILIFGHF